MIAYIILIVVVAVLLIGVGTAMFLRPRGMHGVRRSRNGALDMTGSMPAAKDADTGSEADGGTATATAPPAQRPAEPSAPARPTIEKPPPSAGRMVRLRARLARSQSGFGTALLSLLSRDRLDDDTWDEIEEVLITADVGVTPARQIVSDLRTKVKVAGTRTLDEVRA